MGRKIIAKSKQELKKGKHPFSAEMTDNLIVFMNTKQLMEYLRCAGKKKKSS